MSYKTKIIKLDDTGEQVSIIIDGDGMPVDLASRYLIQKRGNRSSQTLSNLASSICQLYHWSESCGFDIEDRIRSGNILGITDIDSLVRYLTLNRRQVSKEDREGEKVFSTASYVSASVLGQKIDSIKGFISWLGQIFVEKRLITDPYRREITPAIRDLCEQLDARKTRSKSAPRFGLSDNEQKFLLTVTKPGHEKNPFQKRVQFRNNLILRMLLLCGVRLGELLSLQIKNCQLLGDQPYLYFTHNLSKELDPRANLPEAKTLSRKIYISKKLAEEIERYIRIERKHRGRRVTAKVPPYLFLSTSKNPKPLSKGGLYDAFLVLKTKFPIELKGLHPHRLRHTFNDNLHKLFSKEMKEEEFEKLQRWLNGWSDTSKEGVTYTRRSTEMQAQWALNRMHEALLSDDQCSSQQFKEDVDF